MVLPLSTCTTMGPGHRLLLCAFGIYRHPRGGRGNTSWTVWMLHPTAGAGNTVTGTELSAHRMPGSARDHLTANDKPSCQGHKATLCDAAVACILPGQGSRPGWSVQATADNGATVGSAQAMEVSVERGTRCQLAGSGQAHTCLPSRVAGRA